ncbi:MAG: ABC transporter [Alphaproteobacteria bacterium HGW-Alphaproteobacteria-18]|nr:MAG: ABC transporter [Alphaproteobacteria bacterium HGW-Alphaproteobacteria-18]
MISAEHLTVTLNGRDVVRDVSFWLRDGEMVALVGPNGAGKSSVLKALAGVVPSEGDIRIGDAPADKMTVRERAKRLAWLPQTRPVAWNLMAEDVVALGRFADAPAPFDRMGEADRAAVVAALDKADATHLIGRSFQALSGGEQARVHLARLLASPAPVLLLDEPCAALDIAHQLALMAALKAEAAAGRTLIVVLHDLELAARFCPRILVMQAGVLVADGAPEVALSAETLAGVFGVRLDAKGRLERASP